jgi:hypothetical protein
MILRIKPAVVGIITEVSAEVTIRWGGPFVRDGRRDRGDPACCARPPEAEAESLLMWRIV